MDAKIIRSVTEKKIKNLGYTAFFTLVIFSLILGYPTLLSTNSFDVPVPKVENALMLQVGSFVPMSWEKYYVFDQDQVNKLYGINNPLIPNFIQQAFGTYQIIFDEGDVISYFGGVGTASTGFTCPLSTDVSPPTVTSTSQRFFASYPDSDVASTCAISIQRWSVGDSDSPLLPVFFHDYIDQFYIIHDIPDEGDVASPTFFCRTSTVSSDSSNSAVNLTKAYNSAITNSLSGDNVRCDFLNSQFPVMMVSQGTSNDFINSMGIDDTFYELGMRINGRVSSGTVTVNTDPSTQTAGGQLVGWAIDAPEDHTNPFWMEQVHPKFSTKDLTTATYFNSDPEFGFHSGTIDSQKGQVVIFKEFNKTQLTEGDIRVTGTMQAFSSASNLFLRIEAKDGDYHTQNITSFRVNDRELYQYGGSLGVMHLSPEVSSTQTFPYTLSSFRVSQTTLSTGGTCSTTATANLASPIFIFYPVSTLSDDCFFPVPYWDISIIPDNAIILDVDLRLDSNFISSGERTCDVKQMDLDNPVTASAQDLLDDINNGTSYGTLGGCAGATSNMLFDMGTQADTDLQNKLDTNIFSIGLINSPHTRDGFSHNTDIQDAELQVSYSVPQDFDAKLDLDWSQSENEIITVFIGIDDDSTIGRMQVELESFEIDDEVKYDFTDIDYINNYPQTGSTDMSTSSIGVGTLARFDITDPLSGLLGGEATMAWYQSGIANFTVISTTGVTASALPTPESPTSLVATTGTSTGRINLDWTHNELNVTGYEVKILQPTTGLFLSFDNITNAESSYIATGLATGRSHTFKICNARNGDVVNPACTNTDDAIASGVIAMTSDFRLYMPFHSTTAVRGSASLGTSCEHSPSATYGGSSPFTPFMPLSTSTDDCAFAVYHANYGTSFNELLESYVDSILHFANHFFPSQGAGHIAKIPSNWSTSNFTAEDTWQHLTNNTMGSMTWGGIPYLTTTGFLFSATHEADWLAKWDQGTYSWGNVGGGSVATINSTRSTGAGQPHQLFISFDHLGMKMDIPYLDNDKLWFGKTMKGVELGNSCGFQAIQTSGEFKIDAESGSSNDEPQCVLLKTFNKVNVTDLTFQINANSTTDPDTGFPLGKYYFKVFDGSYDPFNELSSTTSPIFPLKGGGLLASVEKTSPFDEIITLTPDWDSSTEAYVTLVIATNNTANPMTVRQINNGFRTWDFAQGTDSVGNIAPAGVTHDTSSYSSVPEYVIISNSTEDDSLISDDVPDTITNLSAINSGTTCNLSWTEPDDNGSVITGYRILRAVDTGSYITLVSNTGTTATTYSDLGLTPLALHSYDVRAINSIGIASGSNIATCTPQSNSPPSQPTNLTLQNVGDDVQLNWTAPSTGAPITGYKIERKVNGGAFFDLVANTGTDSTTYTDTTTDPAIEYAYRVTAINAFGISSVSNEQTILTLNNPNMPTLIAVQNGNQIDLTWTQPTSDSPINGYKIEKRVNNGAFSVLVANTTTTALTYSDLAVIKPNTYGYRVSALSEIGTGIPSNVVDVIFGSHVIIQVREQDGSGFKGGGSVSATNSSFSLSKPLNTQSNAIFDNLVDGFSYNYTFKDYGNFVLNKTLNHIFPSGNNTETVTVFALVFDTDCPINGAGTDVRIKLNYTEFQDITDYPSTPVCDSSDKVSWSTSWFGGNATGFSKMQADFISTRFKTNADQFQRSLIPITTSYDQNINTITSSTFTITTSSTTTINFDLFLGEAPAGGGGGGSGSGGSSAPVESGQSAIPSDKIVIKGQLTGLSVLSRTHPFAKAGDVIQGTITVQWEGESPMTVTRIDVGDFTDIIRFDLPPFQLDQKIIGLGDFANSEADIPYTIVLPPNYCSVEMGITQNCVNQELLTMPIIFEFDFEGVRYEASTEVLVDLRPIPFDIVQFQVILLGVGLIASALAGNAIRKRLQPDVKTESRRKKKFKKRFDSS